MGTLALRGAVLVCAACALASCSKDTAGRSNGLNAGSGGFAGSGSAGTGLAGSGFAGSGFAGSSLAGVSGGSGAAGTAAGFGAAANGGSSGAAGTSAVAGTGGESGTAAAGSGGAGGTAAGAGGTGAAGAGGTDPVMSSGCGSTGTPATGTQMVDVSGTQRSYIIALPTGYDAKKPYRLIFTWHYLGGTADGIARSGYYGQQSRSNGSAIFVSPQGIDNAWPNTGGRDTAFLQVMLDFMRNNYCVDTKRIFSVGFSYGAIMSDTVGCAFGDVFRAIAPMSGSGPRGACKGQVAAWLSHGNQDTTVPFAQGQASRDHWVMANHCQSTTTTVGSCVAYDGCDPGYPVHWCEFTGAHMQPSFAPDAIWAFFSQF